MRIPIVSKDVWRDLYEVAGQFRALSPWKWMEDHEVFGVQSPVSDEIGYCVVLGTLGQVLGLCLYRGSKGLAFHQRIAAEEMSMDDFVGEQDYLMVEFVAKAELEREDKKVISDLGFRYRGEKQYPKFRSSLPGYCPWFLTEPEAQFLDFALHCAIDAARHRREDPTYFQSERGAEYLVYIPGERGGGSYSFSKSWQKPAPLPLPEVPLPKAEIKEITRHELGRDSIWEADFFFLPRAIQDRDRPYFARTIMIAQQPTGMILSMEAIAPEENLYAAVENEILSIINATGLLPKQLHVQDEVLVRAIEPFAQALGFRVILKERLPALSEAREELKQALRSGFFPRKS